MRLDGRFGRFGGTYVPEILVPALEQLEGAFLDSRDEPEFNRELNDLLANLRGPSDSAYTLPEPPRQYLPQARRPASRRSAQDQSSARPRLAREAHGKNASDRRDGRRPARRRDRNRRRAARLRDGHLHGRGGCRAAVAQRLPNAVDGRASDPVESGGRTLKDAINEALRDWSASFETTHYLLGTAAGPHPFPTMVREFQRVIGREAKAQMLDAIGPLARRGIACVGGGSNAIGLFADFLLDDVRLIGVEAAGRGLDGEEHGATLLRGRPGILHGGGDLRSPGRRGADRQTPGRSPRGSIILPSVPSTLS